ncbi:metallophosphoesterase [Pontibacter silvestris]|uniref:Metallophosphoesterase n=1 Tax=Pontibacter silvestris TaxID=2305183 RepID=A0ABW4WXF9_9BACT|nr:metallophosphoesterase [Pontibacter silvestris]MCC9137410.1 metallophosphoesterase [Pontibacter silvestris]
MRRFVTSDSHGGYKALIQCLEKCEFDINKDQLFFIGDVVDGWSETRESLELLLSIKNLVYLLGNHDEWVVSFYTGKMQSKESERELWLTQGGAATVKSYGITKPMPQKHLDLLRKAKAYHVTEDNILFVHAGFDTSLPIAENDKTDLIWNRSFVRKFYKLYTQHSPFTIKDYKEIYVGHTPTISLDQHQTKPLQMNKIIMMDTGAAFTGALSIMDLDSKQVWQSDKVMTLYPSEEGRNKQTWHKMNGSYDA